MLSADTLNYLILKVEMEELPEADDDDSGRDFPYYYVGIPVFAVGGILFLAAYKWAAASQVIVLVVTFVFSLLFFLQRY